jgi:outer membrane protein assembly factor BamB
MPHLMPKNNYISFFCSMAMVIVGCQRTNVTPPHSTTPSDSTKTGSTPTPIDTVTTIYVGSLTALYAVNAQTGAVIWSTDLGDVVANCPLYYQGMIYIATGAQASPSLHALDTSGKVIWSVPLGGGLGSSPSDVYGYNGMVYVCAQLSSPPVAVDASTGAIRWTFPTASLNPLGVGGGNISVTDSVLYFSDFDYLTAVGATSGQILWQVQHLTTKLPGVTGGKVILGDIDASAEALDRQTAAVLWHTAPPNAADVEVQSVNVANGNAYVFDGGTMNVLDTGTGATKLIMTIGGPGGGAVVHSADSNLFVATPSASLVCNNMNTGAQEFALPLYPHNGFVEVTLSGVSSLNNVMYYNYDYLYAASVTTQQVIWKTLLESQNGGSYSTPCLVTRSGKVYRGGNNF